MSSARRIQISGLGSISPLGANSSEAAHAYEELQCRIKQCEIEGREAWAAELTPEAEICLAQLVEERPKYRELDRAVLLAILASREAFQASGWSNDSAVGVLIGSSRGATGLFEHNLRQFDRTGRARPHSSPTTTLGNISSAVGRDLALDGVQISHSVTCSSALHAIANAVAWIRAGLCPRFLAGAAEAPLTAFTVAQMEALGIAKSPWSEWPCRPLGGKNSFVLGEGASIFAVEAETGEPGPKYFIEGLGFAQEISESPSGITESGQAFQLAMQRAIEQCGSPEIDLVVLHAPGTELGDRAELQALSAVFKNDWPPLTSNKFLLGHTLGVSGGLSLEYAINILKYQRYNRFPYEILARSGGRSRGGRIKRIMLNAAGFGGNAVSLVLSKQESERDAD